jgi:hypothetical protein
MTDTPSTYQTRTRRPRNVTTRFSEAEFAQLSTAATDANLALADWFRRTILDSLAPANEPTIAVLLEEVQAIKLTLASTVFPILSGKRMTEEQSAALLRDCDAAKTDAAKKVITTFRARKDRP